MVMFKEFAIPLGLAASPETNSMSFRLTWRGVPLITCVQTAKKRPPLSPGPLCRDSRRFAHETTPKTTGLPRRLPQGTKTHKPVQRDTNATPTDETTSGTGGRETVKRQIGCRGALSAITVDIDTVSQSHILRQGKRARARLGNRGAVPRTGGRIKPGLGPDTGGTH